MGKISRKELLEQNYMDLFEELGLSERSQTIIRRYASGDTASQIAKDFPIGPGSVRDVVQRFMVSASEYNAMKVSAQNADYTQKAKAAHLSEDKYKIVQLFCDGLSFKEIAEKTAKSIVAVRRVVSGFNRIYNNFENFVNKEKRHIRVGQYLKYLRESNGITIDDFSNHFFLSPKTVISYESGKVSSIPGDLSLKVAAYYCISHDQFWNPPESFNA